MTCTDVWAYVGLLIWIAVIAGIAMILATIWMWWQDRGGGGRGGFDGGPAPWSPPPHGMTVSDTELWEVTKEWEKQDAYSS